MSTTHAAQAPGARDPADDDFWTALLHRWFVHYNPLYLASAMLVLAGLTLVSRGLVEQGSQRGLLGVALLAEVYAWSLVGGAALLVRVGQRRPAVWLALLALVYQMDLTLHTQTCAALGLAGVAPAALWLASFVGKLAALGRATRVQVAPRALAAAGLAAAGLAALPFGLYRVAPATLGAAMALFVMALGAAVPRRLGASAASHDALDAWGQTVLRRVNVAAWAIGGALLAMHMVLWSVEGGVALWPAGLALGVLFVMRRLDERNVWLAAAVSLAPTALASPRELALVALIWSLGLALRAFSTRLEPASPAPAPPAGEPAYRDTPPAPPVAPAARWVSVPAAERLRLLTGALAAGYLALWTHGWQGGALPAHVWLLDLALVGAALLMAWRLGARLVLLVVASTLGHATASAGLVPAPRGLVEWGAALLALGFGLLFASLAVSYRLRAASPAAPGAPAPR